MTKNNVELNPGSGGDIIRTVTEGNVKTQAVAMMGTQTDGTLAYVPADQDSNLRTSISIADTLNLDAFSRLRVSNPVTLFSVQSVYDTEPLLMESGSTGSGTTPTFNSTSRMVTLETAGTGTSFHQSYEYVPYQPGKSQLIFVTGLLGAGVANAIVDVGLFDANNGLIYRQNGTSGLQLILRSAAGNGTTTVNQADWNIDPMDGTGPSGLTLNPENVFILAMDAQYLGMGRARVAFDIDGVLVPVHQFMNANLITTPYMQQLTLPIQMLITSTSATKTAYFKCASVSTEGGLLEDFGYTFNTPEQTVTAAGTRKHLMSIRPLTTFNGITNRTKTALLAVEMLVGANTVFWEMSIGATFTAGPTWGGSVNATYSATEYTTAPGTVNAVGTVFDSGYVVSSNATRGTVAAQIAVRYPITLNRAGAVRANGTVSLFVTSITGTSACRAGIQIRETR